MQAIEKATEAVNFETRTFGATQNFIPGPQYLVSTRDDEIDSESPSNSEVACSPIK